MTVVGIVDDVNDSGLGDEPGPAIYIPYRQDNQPTVGMALLARLSSDVAPTERVVKAAIAGVDPGQAVNRIALVDQLSYESAAGPRFQSLVTLLFGAGALVLVGGGIYALTLFTVLKRTRELGLRAALGAEPRALVAHSAWHGVRPVVWGIVSGVLLCAPAMRAMDQFLGLQLQRRDLPWMAAAVIVMLVVGAVAALAPSRRALRISPMVALRA